MTDYTLRPAREMDANAIKRLIHSVGINPMNLDWRHFIVAVDGQNQVIATGQIKPHSGNIFERLRSPWSPSGAAKALPGRSSNTF